MTTRRSLITGLISFVAAPAIVRAASLMPVKSLRVEPLWEEWELVQAVLAREWRLRLRSDAAKKAWAREIEASGAGWIAPQ